VRALAPEAANRLNPYFLRRLQEPFCFPFLKTLV